MVSPLQIERQLNVGGLSSLCNKHLKVRLSYHSSLIWSFLFLWFLGFGICSAIFAFASSLAFRPALMSLFFPELYGGVELEILSLDSHMDMPFSKLDSIN